MKFKTADGQSVELTEIKNLIEEEFDYRVYVGTDSQVHRSKKKVLYATCIVLHKKGKGGRMFIWKEWDRNVELRQRLMNETWRSLQTSFSLKEILPHNVDIEIHLDVNSHKKARSSDYYQELVGMVTGQGFTCHIKPDSFAAMCVADKYSK